MYDCTDAITSAFAAAVNEFNSSSGKNYRIPDPAYVISLLGVPVYLFYPQIYSYVDKSDLEALSDLSENKLHEAVSGKKGEIYGQVNEIIEYLHGKGIKIAAASNGSRDYVERFLSAYGLTSFFQPLITLGGTVKTKNEILADYIRRGSYDKVYMIGDRESDRAAARANGAEFIYCNYGHSDGTEVKEYDRMIHSFSELKMIL